MIAPSRREGLQPIYEQSSNSSGRSQERLADAHGSTVPIPPESVRPAAADGPSVAAKKDAILQVAGRPRWPSFLSHDLDRSPCYFCHVQHPLRKPDPTPSDSTVAASTTSIPPDTTESPLSGLGFVEILDLTGNAPPKRRCTGCRDPV